MMSRDPSVSDDAAAAGETESDVPSSAHVLVTGHEDPARAVCPACCNGVLAIEPGRCECPECGFGVPGAIFVLLQGNATERMRRRRRTIVIVAAVSLVLFILMLERGLAFDSFILLAGSMVLGGAIVPGLILLSVFVGTGGRAADVITEAGIVPVRAGRLRPLVPWSRLQACRLWKVSERQWQLVYETAGRWIGDWAPVPAPIAEPLRAHLQAHVPDVLRSDARRGPSSVADVKRTAAS